MLSKRLRVNVSFVIVATALAIGTHTELGRAGGNTFLQNRGGIQLKPNRRPFVFSGASTRTRKLSFLASVYYRREIVNLICCGGNRVVNMIPRKDRVIPVNRPQAEIQRRTDTSDPNHVGQLACLDPLTMET